MHVIPKFLKYESQRISLSQYLIYGYLSEGNHIIPPLRQPQKFGGDTLLWILPIEGNENSLMIHCDKYSVKSNRNGQKIILFNNEYKITEYPARPACDFYGNLIVLDIDHGSQFLEAYAHFYWDNLLPQIAERTMMLKKKDIREGYVLSTLATHSYAGTYPAVDHEFHFKGRYAVGGKAEASLIKRMLELQMKIMREDKKGISRNVCAIQPNRSREYDVWRDSQDHTKNAQMFRITANIEFIEAMYRYYSMTKNLDFVQKNIAAVEKNCDYIERFIEEDDLLNSHVYFEDQVIKDGKVAQAQCFAINGFRLMAKLEALIGNSEKKDYYEKIAARLGTSYIKDFPNGFWDPDHQRYIDWIDGSSQPHDHIHLLANELPCLFSLATEDQRKSVEQLVLENDNVFSKFPSFIAAKIEDYTPSEIGTGGPYDLCAAGRYWCWDAMYKAFMNQKEILLQQLLQVSAQAKKDNYLMGERYDMDYIYYIDGKEWHGSSQYYEYPNVFLFVLISQYLGVNFGFDCDISVKPLIVGDGTVQLPNYGIKYSLINGHFSLENLTNNPLSIEVDLTGIGKEYLNKMTLDRNSQIDL
jgi:hypothetical protein